MGESRRLGDEAISLLGDLLRGTGDLLRGGESGSLCLFGPSLSASASRLVAARAFGGVVRAGIVNLAWT